jgi:hypothetical protein
VLALDDVIGPRRGLRPTEAQSVSSSTSTPPPGTDQQRSLRTSDGATPDAPSAWKSSVFALAVRNVGTTRNALTTASNPNQIDALRTWAVEWATEIQTRLHAEADPGDL